MNNYRDRLRTEIAEKVAALDKPGADLHPDWITHAICKDHEAGLVKGPDEDFWRHVGRSAVRAEVGVFLRRRYPGAEAAAAAASDNWPVSDAQLVLPGYEHVQPRYMVERGGDITAVATPLIPDEELREIAARLLGDGKSRIAHANELLRYLEDRRLGAAVGG